MKDLLIEKIELDVKIHWLQITQSYYQGRMDYSVYSDLVAKLNEGKKKLTVLVTDTADLTIRDKVINQQYPYSFYCKHLRKDED